MSNPKVNLNPNEDKIGDDRRIGWGVKMSLSLTLSLILPTVGFVSLSGQHLATLVGGRLVESSVFGCRMLNDTLSGGQDLPAS